MRRKARKVGRCCATITTLVLLAMLLTPSGRAVAQPTVGNPMPAVHANRWADAATAAAGYADPVAEKLVTYLRLSAPDAATAPEIAAFMAQNPDWPNQALLEKRREQALATETDPAVLAVECPRARLTETGALLACAAAEPGEAGIADARRAWITGIVDPAAEVPFLARWTSVLRPEDQRERFDTLAWSDPGAAQLQIARLPTADRPAAAARLAFRRDDPTAPAEYAALSAAQRDAAPNAAGLFLEQARFLRRANQDAAALALWQAQGTAAEAVVPAAHASAFWAERMTLARKLLTSDGDAAGAAALAAAHGEGSGAEVADAAFFAGFVDLRRLHDPASAQRQFAVLAAGSTAVLSLSRAHYWLARAIADAGGDPTAEYTDACGWPTTFYGQLACQALKQDPAIRIRALHDPAATREQALDLTAREVVRAAVLLVAWGEPRRARAFILRMDELAPSPGDRVLTARLAIALGMPDMAVFIARRMGRDGLVLPDAGWPLAFDPPAGVVDPALALGVMRQESSFDVAAVSPSGARGLMQLMPATAQAVAHQTGEPTTLASLTVDPAHNMRLGTAYLHGLLEQFANSVPLAVAAYNAGPNRVDQWLAANGDPRGAPGGGATSPGGTVGAPDMVDWIELIPFGETRNYVQRVLENTEVYRAKLHEAATSQLAQGAG